MKLAAPLGNLEGIAAQAEQEMEKAEREAAKVRALPAYKDAERELKRLRRDFFAALSGVGLYATRMPGAYRDLMVFRWTETYRESVFASELLADVALTHPAARELRYLVEALAKFLYVDQKLVGRPLEDKLVFFADEVPANGFTISGPPRTHLIDELDLQGLRVLEGDFKAQVKSIYGELSGFVHPSQKQLESWDRRLAAGLRSHMELLGDLKLIVRLARQVYESALVLIFHGLGMPLTGDVFVAWLDDEPSWSFHKTKFTRAISANFDYKVERKHKVGTP